MNIYWLVALLILLGAVGAAGYRFGHDSMEVSCQKHDEAQQQHVIGQMQTQNQITEEFSNAYHNGVSAIDDLYRVQPTGNSTQRPISTPSCGAETSKRYKLTFKQCDDEEFKCNKLWNWAQSQGTVK